jgi:hypothetical protein
MDRKKKTFDAVKMVREIREKHHRQLQGKTKEERLAFYRKRARKLHKELDGHKGKETA